MNKTRKKLLYYLIAIVWTLIVAILIFLEVVK